MYLDGAWRSAGLVARKGRLGHNPEPA
jgi:hypothetical protein